MRMMNFGGMARLAGVAVLAVGLSGCFDVSMDIEILSETEGRGTVVASMEPDVYELFSSGQAEASFCGEGEEIEITDTLVTCTKVEEGSFADLDLGVEDGDEGPSITALGNGQVRVSFPSSELLGDPAEDQSEDEQQMQQMMLAMFAGHTVTLSVSGGPVLDTNMELAEDGNSASIALPFGDLMSRELDLPDELYAVIQVQ